MAHFVIAAYRPHPGKETELLELVREHLPILRSRGLATDLPPYVMRAANGTILEVFQWVSEEATRKAHEDPAVLELWERFGAVSDFVTLEGLEELKRPFPHFETVAP